MAGHVPLRRCVGCGRVAPKPDLVRLASVSAGVDDHAPRRVVIDPDGRLPGRGAYLCREQLAGGRGGQPAKQTGEQPTKQPGGQPTGRPRRECVVLAERRKAFARAFRQPVDVPEEIVESVIQ